MNKSIFVLMAAVAALAGCASGVGTVEGATPPRIIETKDGRVWDNIGAFGPVPANLAKTGAQICSSINSKWVAIGYHSRAQGLDGKAIAGGGYVCGAN